MDESEVIKTLAEQATEIRKNSPISPEEVGNIKHNAVLLFAGLSGCLDIIVNVITSKEEITELVKKKSWIILSIIRFLMFIVLGVMYMIIKKNTSLIADDSALYYLISGGIALIGVTKASMIFTNFITRAQEDANSSLSRVFSSVADKTESLLKTKGKKDENDDIGS